MAIYYCYDLNNNNNNNNGYLYSAFLEVLLLALYK